MRLPFFASLLALVGITSVPADAANHTNQEVGEVQIDRRPCLFLILKNVSQADPAVPGVPWFAIPTGSANYQTFASLVLSAKGARQPVYARTDGTLSCGYATVAEVGLH